MKKSNLGFFCQLISTALLLVLGITVTSCSDEEPAQLNIDNALGDLDGLWVQQVKHGSEIVPHIDINGSTAILCKSKPDDYDYTDRVTGTIRYNVASRKGYINFEDGTDLEFLCDDQGNFCSADTIPYYKIDNTLDGLQALKVEPRLQLGKEYVGPDHDLGIDLSINTLLGDSLGETLGEEGAWYAELLKFAGESVAKGALSWIGGEAMSAIVDCFYTDPTSKKLESILAQVEAINTKLAEIEQLVKMENYEHYINDRAKTYTSPLGNYSKRYADAMDAVDKTDSTAIADIVNHWHDDAVSIDIMDAASNYMDFIMNTLVDNTNLYNIYDIYTYNSVPWESLGYDFRQSLRGSDLTLITENVNMAILYAKIHDWDKIPYYKSFVPDLNEKFQKFIKFCDSNPVDVKKDVLVCQIPNAHFVMSKEFMLRDFNLPDGMTWYTVGSQFVHGDYETSDLVFFGGAGMSIQQLRKKQFTWSEMAALDNYYDKAVAFGDMFRALGVSIPQSCIFLVLDGKTSSDYSDKLYATLSDIYLTWDRGPKYTDWLLAKTHWSFTFKYWFDGWNTGSQGGYWVDACASDVLYRY